MRICLCTDKKDNKICGKCMSCKMYLSGLNPDLFIIKSEGTIGIDEIRDMQKQLLVRPLYSEKKIYLIIDANKMTVQAQNCLLKTLEEPPKHVIIILTVSNLNTMLETIQSRIVKFNFKKNTFDEIKLFLSQKNKTNIENLDFIALYSDGIIGRALDFIESDEFMSLRESIISLIIKLMKTELSEIFVIYDFFDKNKKNINTVLDIIVLFYRDLLVIKKVGEGAFIINSDKRKFILDNANTFNSEMIMNNIEVIEMTRKIIKQNANFQLAIEVMFMKLKGINFN